MNLNYLLIFGIILFLRFYGENNDLYTALGLIVIFFVMRNITEGIVGGEEEGEDGEAGEGERRITENLKLIHLSEVANSLPEINMNIMPANFTSSLDALSTANVDTLTQIYDISDVKNLAIAVVDNMNNTDNTDNTDNVEENNPEETLTSEHVKNTILHIQRKPKNLITMNFIKRYIEGRYSQILDSEIPPNISQERSQFIEMIRVYEHLLVSKLDSLGENYLHRFYDSIKENRGSPDRPLLDELMGKLIQLKQISFEYSRFMFPTFILLMISFFSNFVSEKFRPPNSISADIYQYVQTYIATYCSENSNDTRCAEEAGILSPSQAIVVQEEGEERDNQDPLPSPEIMVVAPGAFGAEGPDTNAKCTDYPCPDGKELKSSPSPGQIDQGDDPETNCCEPTTVGAPPPNTNLKCTGYTCPSGTKLKSDSGQIDQADDPNTNCCENPCSSPLNYFAGSSPNCICSPLESGDEGDRKGYNYTWLCYEGEYAWLKWTGIIVGIIVGILFLGSVMVMLVGRKKHEKKSSSSTSSLTGQSSTDTGRGSQNLNVSFGNVGEKTSKVVDTGRTN